MRRNFNAPRRQRGVTLVIVLMLLVIVTLLGVGAARIALLGERTTRNERDYQIAWQAAEAALMDAQFDIRGPNSGSAQRVALFTPENTSNFVPGCNTSAEFRGMCAPSEGKPVWAQVGMPGVELGRLSVARSPDQVLQRAYDEALASLSPEMVDFYSMSLDEMILELSTNWDNITIIDSPLQNLALLEDALDGTSQLTSLGVTNTNDTLMAVFLGVASDKNVAISPDTAIAVSTILGTPLSDAEAAALAADAEAIRIAVLAGHG